MIHALGGNGIGNFREEYAQQPLLLRRDKNYAFEILSDPDEEAGFYRGAKFKADEVQEMLRQGFFTPGTTLLWCAKKSDAEMVVFVGTGKYGFEQGFYCAETDRYIGAMRLTNGEE